ncbi:hypothetical protein GCM10022215_25470 [Nocardioides fonticola]|uniref:Lipoprotein n=1 Tax=Nocardioides fonticola TaxID=450363 RepID=A0ABP7XKL4_9ACTN
MSELSHPRRRLAALAASAAILAALAGCSAEADSAGDDAGSSGSSGSATTSASSAADPDATPEATPSDPASDPVTSPYVVAAVAAARRSVDQVQQVHALWVATADDTGIPRSARVGLARTIRAALAELITVDTRLPPPAGTPAARLATVLEQYRALVARLAAGDGVRVPAGFGDDLARVDARWRSVLTDLGGLAGEDLLADVPTLLSPRSR